MSAALTSSTFVGAKVSVAKTTTASKRVAFSVQANASGPKKVRIPISFFFVRLKNHHPRSFQAGGGASKFCISSNEKVMRLRAIFLRNVDEAVVCEFWKRSMRVYSDAKVHFERNYARLGAFQPSRRVRPRATDFEFYFIFFVCLFDTPRFVKSRRI